jgi:hypothetical protein
VDDDRRREIMERLAEMLQGPPPTSGAGPDDDDDADGDMEDALAELPEEAAALFRAMFESFSAWQQKPRRSRDDAGEDAPPEE